jgi:C-terminal processing protease CtpA/Prc
VRKWLVFLAVIPTVIAVTAAVAFIRSYAAHGAFHSLPVPQQSLALYDAVWAAIDSNYYDPKLLASPKLQDLRARLRPKAAAADSLMIYFSVFQELTKGFPGSHVAINARFTDAQLMAAAFPVNTEHGRNLNKAFAAGWGFFNPVVRRGNETEMVVGEVMAGSPAAKAGITPGWKILSAGARFGKEDAAAHFTGKFLPPEPGAAPVEIKYDLEPGLVRAPFEMRQLERGVSYVRFDSFGLAVDPEQVIAAIDTAGPQGLVLDLRTNIGGVSDVGLRIAGRLLGDGVITGIARGRSGEEIQRTKSDRHYAGPLAILIGPTSSSAAEILAAAVQDHARGKIVGRPSNGSVLVARVFPLPDGGSVMVPIQDFVRGDGRHIEGIGVMPDIEVMPTLEDARTGRDPALERAAASLHD